jgi:Ca-activated chloride channel family protein
MPKANSNIGCVIIRATRIYIVFPKTKPDGQGARFVRSAILFVVPVVLLFLLVLAVAFAQRPVASQVRPPQPTPSPTSTAEEIGEGDVIKVNTNLVTSSALVVGRDRKYVPTLNRHDFHVFEDGVEQELTYFAAVDEPFTVALLIDNSRSTTFELRNILDAAVALIDQMRANDRALVISLDDDVKTLIGATNNKDELRQAISQIKSGGGTRLYDAFDFALNQALAGIKGRRAIVLLTDGVDNASRNAGYQTNINDIAKSDVQVYAVQFSTFAAVSKQTSVARRPAPEGTGFSRVDYQRADAYLHQISELTGTSVYPAADLNRLDAAVASIVAELHNEYSLGYYPRTGKPGEVHRVEVRVNQPWLVVRGTRSGYSLGKGGTVTYQVKNPVVASISEINPGSGKFPEEKKPSNARWICKGPFVPGDYALVQEGFDSKCPTSTRPNDQTNAWFIRKPGPTETVCKGFVWSNGAEVQASTIPSGYAVVGEVHSKVCSSSLDRSRVANAWKVKLPTSKDTVCKGFLIPRGFVVVGEKKVGFCPATSTEANAWMIMSVH